MYRVFFLLIFLISLGFSEQAIKPKVGIYITSLNNFDIQNGSFDTIFWMWYLHKKEKNYNPNNTTELIDAEELKFLYNFEDIVDEKLIWNTQKVRAKIIYHWDYKHYPFDTQRLEIKFEDSNYDYNSLKFIPDITGSKISNKLKIDGWEVVGFKVEERKNTMDTTFGDPTIKDGKSTFSQFIATIDIKRGWYREFITKVLPFYLVFLILCLSFVFKESYTTKNAMYLTSIFILIGNKSIISTTLPPTNVITLIDKLQFLTFFITILFISVLAISIALDAKGKKKLEHKLNGAMVYGVLPFYILVNIYLLYNAINNY